MNHLYEDKSGIIHLCEGSRVQKGIYLVWTKCEKDVPPRQSFKSREVATCKSCLAAEAELKGRENEETYIY